MAGIHYVCTREEARELADNAAEFWIGNCFCREGKEGKCERSRHDVCVWFTVEEAEEGHEQRFSLSVSDDHAFGFTRRTAASVKLAANRRSQLGNSRPRRVVRLPRGEVLAEVFEHAVRNRGIVEMDRGDVD